MAEFELKITGSMAELFAIASRLGGATASPSVIAEPQRAPEPVGSDTVQVVVTAADVSAAALDTAAAAPRKRRTKAEIAADEAAAKPSAFETPVADEVVEGESPEPDLNEEVADTAPLETSQPTSDVSPAATSDSATWQDCHDMMDLIVNKQKPPAAPLKVLEALKGATNGEITNLSALKERPDMLAKAYTALAQFKTPA